MLTENGEHALHDRTDDGNRKSYLCLRRYGVVASWDDDNAWWMITKDGEMTSKGMNELPVSEGDRYEAVYTIGY